MGSVEVLEISIAFGLISRRMCVPFAKLTQHAMISKISVPRGRIGAAVELLDRGFAVQADVRREIAVLLFCSEHCFVLEKGKRGCTNFTAFF